MAFIKSPEEQVRKEAARKRVALYRDQTLNILNSVIDKVYLSSIGQMQMRAMSPLSISKNLVKRFADEIANPIYSRAPVRHLDPESDEPTYNALIRESGHDEVMDRVASLLEAVNDIIVGIRVVEDEGMTLDIYTPDMVTVIPNKDNPTRSLGIAYESAIFMQGRFHPTWVVWDDEVWFMVDHRGHPLRDITPHELGRKPFAEFHRNAPWQTYWDSYRGNDVESAQLRIGILAAQMLSVIKDQGHLQLAWVGPTNANPKPMQAGTATVLRFDNMQGTGDVKVLNLQAQISQYIDAIKEEESMVGAAHGFSRERLNLSTDIHGSDVALLEQTEQLMQRMVKGEKDLFELYKIISLQHSEFQLEPDAKLRIDYGPLYHRTDRKTQLELRKEEIAQGVRSPIDSVREDNPEIQTDEEARLEFEENISDMAELLRMRMEHNLATDANMVDQGQDARANGALGPAVRDGQAVIVRR